MSKTLSGIALALVLLIALITCIGMAALVAVQGDWLPNIPIRNILNYVSWAIFLLVCLGILKDVYLHISKGIRGG